MVDSRSCRHGKARAAAALVLCGLAIAACSPVPGEPAPVYVMGVDGPTDRYAPVTPGPRPAAGQPARRYAMTPPEVPAARPIGPEHGSKPAVSAANQSIHSRKKTHAGHPAMPHAVAAHRAKATPASATKQDASATMIPLDDPAPERTPASSWVSPPPADRAPGGPAP